MPTPDSLQWRKRPMYVDYGAAALAVAVALFIARLMQAEYEFQPLTPFLCAIMFSAWLGGLKPGIFALALSLLLFHNFMLAPLYSSSTEKELPRLLLAASTALFIMSLTAAQRSAAEKVRTSERRYLLLFDTIPTMAWSLLPGGAIEFMNRRWLNYAGLSLKEALEDSSRTVHPEDFPAMTEKWLVNMAARAPFESEMRLRRADGAYRWFLVRTVPLKDERGNIVKWYGTSTDIEDRKQAENALRDAASQLQALSRRMVELQESERKELSRELHDRVGQTLTALSINLAILRQGQSGDDAEARSRLDDSAALVESSMQSIENVLADLRPQMLDDHGLRAALEWYARQFSARAEMAVSVRAAEPDERMAAEVEIALFRIAQEGLNNVAKHARASSVVIALDCRGAECVMSVTDDGTGLRAADEKADGMRPGLGMVTMRERAQAVGGEIRIETLPEGGTRLTARIPKRG
jgi:PAS domain S-box-containing protein